MKSTSKKVLIIEDETYAAKNLIRKIKDLRPNWQIIDTCQSVEDSIEKLKEGANPDIIFSDIELTDGLSFEIFKEISLWIPVIFTTAYSQYALEAFKYKGFAYLLKPIDTQQLETHIKRIEHLEHKDDIHDQVQRSLSSIIDEQRRTYKSRFLVKKGDRFYALPTDSIRLVFFDECSWALDIHEIKHPLDYSLNYLEKLLDPTEFFRTNRQAIIHRSNLIHASQHFNGRLKLKLHIHQGDDIYVSRDRVASFKEWIEG